MKLNDLRKTICLRRSEFSSLRNLVYKVIGKLVEHDRFQTAITIAALTSHWRQSDVIRTSF